MTRCTLSFVMSDDLAEMDDAYKKALDEYAQDLRDVIGDNLVGFYSHILGENPKKITTKEARWFALNGNSGVSVVTRRGSKYGVWHSYADKKGGGPFQAIAHYLGVTGWRNILDEAADWAHVPRFDPAAVRKSVSEQFLKEREEKARKREEKEREATIKEAQEDGERIRAAQACWDNSVDIVGTLGENYLTVARGINLGDTPVRWPASVRWSTKERALIFKVEDPDGNFVGSQIVAVTRDGRQDKTRYGRIGAKKSGGKISLGYVLFTGKVDGGPICYCEGPETGLSIWLATGHEVRVMLGSHGFRRISQYHPKGRTAVLCRDDDAMENAAYRAAVTGLYELARLEHDVCDAWAFEDRKFKGADFNDLMQQLGASAVAQRINESLTERLVVPRDELTPQKAKELLGQRIGNFFAEARSCLHV